MALRNFTNIPSNVNSKLPKNLLYHMTIGLWFRLKSPLYSHLTKHLSFARSSEIIVVILGGNFKSHSYWYLLICFLLSFWGLVYWLEGVRGPLAIEMLWSFHLTSRNLQSAFAGSVHFFQLHVRCAFCLMYNCS